MPSQKVSSEIPVWFVPRWGMVEKVMLADARGVLGKAFTTAEVTIP
jgi:hypothetical protein